MLGYPCDELGDGQTELRVATYDLAAAAASASGDGTGGWDWAAYTYRPVWEEGEVAVAMCGGETFVFHDARLHVLARRPGGRKLVEVVALDQPSTTPGVPPDYEQARLVTHRGAVFFVAVNGMWSEVMAWRLARDGERLQWEAAARLHVGELEAGRLTGLMCSDCPVRKGSLVYCVCPWGMYGVRDFVYCTVGGRPYNCSQQLIVRLNLHTGEWELVHDDGEQQPTVDWDEFTNGLELRPDLFL